RYSFREYLCHSRACSLLSLVVQPVTPVLFTLSLHDALPIYASGCGDDDRGADRAADWGSLSPTERGSLMPRPRHGGTQFSTSAVRRTLRRMLGTRRPRG